MITITNNIVKIDTNNTSYIMRATLGGYVEHIYYGAKISDRYDIDAIAIHNGSGQGCSVVRQFDGNTMWPDNCCVEHSSVGRGDYRECIVDITFADNSCVHELLFDSWQLIDNHTVPELPNTHSKEQTLQIVLVDKARNIRMDMYYSTFEGSDVIVRNNKLTNLDSNGITVNRLMSSQLDLPTSTYTLDTLDGAWAKERYIHSTPLTSGTITIDSKRGTSSNCHNPYIVLRHNKATLDNGSCYGINLSYSGNHKEIVETTPLGKVRVLNGINDHGFRWQLQEGECLVSPEATLCYSNKGTNGLTQSYHHFVNNHVVRGQWAHKERPILINNWEATYFDFSEKKLLDLAKRASNLGIELFVLDDGWFGSRTSDKQGLGDWTVNTKRLPGGLEGLISKINKTGMKFGLWVEPEMVNPNSQLYKTHPEWAISHPLYQPCEARNQLALDLSNRQCCDYIIDSMSKIFGIEGITYIKWDYNRPLTDYYSHAYGDQGGFFHKYMLGLYYILDTLTTKFPHILFESCASGGNRVDLGILSYMPQFWTSDNTDSFDRVRIQEGTLTCYPQSTMGCHVSASPNHQTLRPSSIDSRFNCACIGAFGYELDLAELTSMDAKRVKSQIEWFKKYRKTLQFGTYYKTSSIFTEDNSSWIVVNSDATQAVANFTNGIAETVCPQQYLPITGLDDSKMYNIKTRQQIYSIKQFGSLINMIAPIHVKEEGKLQNWLDNNLALLKGECQNYTMGGDVLNTAGMSLCSQWMGTGLNGDVRILGDFGSRLYGIDEVE